MCNKYYEGETGYAFRSNQECMDIFFSVKKSKVNRVTPVSKHFIDDTQTSTLLSTGVVQTWGQMQMHLHLK